MKIDFQGKSMTIHFDKVPSFLYFNKDNEGCGALFIDGKRIRPLGIVDMHAQSRGIKAAPLHYRATYVDKKHQCEKSIGDFSIFKCGTVEVKIMDTEPFHTAIDNIDKFVNDKRIPAGVRQEYADKFVKDMSINPTNKE